MSNRKSIEIAEDLKVRLGALANRSGHTVEEMADLVLRNHVDAQERAILEGAEDERRWQRYLEAGQTLTLNTVRGKLHALAREAEFQAESR